MTGIILMLGVIAVLIVIGFESLGREICKRLDGIGIGLVALELKMGIGPEEIVAEEEDA